MAEGSIEDRYRELRERADGADQGHIFQWWDRLDEAQRRELLAQVEDIDFAWLDTQLERLVGESETPAAPVDLKPCEILDYPRTPEQKQEADRVYALGEEALGKGLVAPFLVAGGQGSRLGFAGPKGAYPVGPVTGNTLFQFHAEKIRRIWDKYGRATRWYIQTSPVNDQATRACFADNGYFGMDPDRVRFFAQRMVPSVTLDGKIVMASPFEIFRNPNGTGGIYPALSESGSLDEMTAEGVKCMFYFQVDNLIVEICDPWFIGCHIDAGSEMSLKIVEKRDGDEPIGVVGYRNGRMSIIEYSDMSREDKHARGNDGRLIYRAGSIAIHIIDVEFAKRQMARGFRLPFHRAVKNVPKLDADGRRVDDPDYKGIKFETFVFDALPDARKALVLETLREEDFSPIKNPEKEDSPGSARAMAMDNWRSWFGHARLEPPQGDFELSALFAFDRRDFVARVRAGDDPGPFIAT